MRRSRGFTMLELLVTVGVGTVVITAATMFVSHQARHVGYTKSRLDSIQDGRAALYVLMADARHAGLGVGYQGDRFAGMIRGNFSVTGGATFSGNNRQIALARGTQATDDLALRMADGRFSSIAAFMPGGGQICAGSGIGVGDTVLLVSEDTLASFTGKITGLQVDACAHGTCISGCESFTYADDTSYASEAGASALDYAGGEMISGYKSIVWFVEPNAAGTGELRRAVVNASSPCQDRATCGGVVAENVETLQLRVSGWDETTGAWVDRTADAELRGSAALRIDIELVVRSRSMEQKRSEPVQLQLEPGACIPGPCGAESDRVARRTFRTSIDVRNSGRMGVM